MKKDVVYMLAAAAAISLILYFKLAATARPPDAFMASLTLFVTAAVLIPLVLMIGKEEAQ